MNKKIIIGLLSLIFVFSSKAQETLIVRGHLGRPGIDVSDNFKKNMFGYLNGNFVMSEFNRFCTFRVNSVISGSFPNFNQEINKTPFNIALAVINECRVLDYDQEYILRIKQFPNSDYYYIDSINQVFPNEAYLDKLAEYYENHQQNVDILTKGTLQERYDFLDSIQKNIYTFRQADYRYIPYIIPFMTSKDSVTAIYEWHGHWYDDSSGNTGPVYWYDTSAISYAGFLYRYLDGRRFLPFALPEKTTDSTGWHKWYDSLISQENYFSSVKYAPNQHRTISSSNDGLLHFFVNIPKREIYFRPHGRNPQVYNIDTETLSQNETSKSCEGHSFFPFYENYSMQINKNDLIPALEIPRYSHWTYTDAPPEGIELFTMTEGGLCKWRFKKDIPVKLYAEETNQRGESITIHKGDDFLIFWTDRLDGHNCLRAGKVNRNGEWIVEPKNLYEKIFESYNRIGGFSFYQSNQEETIFAFRNYDRKSSSHGEKDVNAIIIFKLNGQMEITDSVVFTIEFPSFDYRFTRTHLLKKDSTYLLVAEVSHNRGYQLYYRLLNDDLTPKTDFIKLADQMRRAQIGQVGKPILTSEGFMISWVDNDLSENVVRSVILEPSGRQANIVNITNHKVDQIHNVEFDQNTVDIYLFSREEKSLIRKRINKREYGFPVNLEHGRWIPPRSEKQAYQEVRRHITRHMYWGEDEDGNPIILEAQDRGVGFPGGETARREYLNQNLKYPKSARRKGVQGTVRVEFWVDKDGSIREPKIDRGIREGCSWCNEEAIRLVQGMPKWLPETYNGNPVDVQIIMPIEFKIDPKGFLQKNEINVNTTAQGKRSRQRIRLNIFTGRIGGAKGLDVSVSGLYTATEGNINGVQLSGLANLRAKTDEGKIISNLLQYTDSSRTNGMQLSGLVNLGANMNGLQISGLLNSNKSLNGMSISGLGNSVDKQVNGIQVAGLVNHLDDEKGSINGIQLSGIVNFGMGKANGVQMSGFVNLALGGMNGIQVSSILNMTETLKGIQISGLLNVAGGMKGIQMSGLLNVAGGINGVQMSGIVNYGKGETKGVQIAGLFNNSDTLSGVSIAGIYNRAKVLNGVQIGLISKNDTIRRGGSLSLINIVKKGAYKGWELAFSDYANVALSYKMGTPKLYTIYSAGVHFLDDNFWVVGIGFGNRTYVGGKFFFRPELTYSNYFPINFKNIQHTSDTRLKLGFEYRINNKFSLSLAPSVYMMNARKGSNPESEYYRISPIEALYTQERGNRQTVVGVGISVGLSLK